MPDLVWFIFQKCIDFIDLKPKHYQQIKPCIYCLCHYLAAHIPEAQERRQSSQPRQARVSLAR